MTYEHRPEGFDHHFNPLDDIDHKSVCAQVREHFLHTDNVSVAMQKSQDVQQELDEETYRLLFTVGYYFVPTDAEGKLTGDIERLRVYVSGLVAALETLDVICEQSDIDLGVFRKALRIGGDIKILNVNQKMFENASEQEKHNAVSEGILFEGRKYLDTIDPEYATMIEDISDNYPEVVTQLNVFKSSYGYSLGNGLSTIRRILNEREAQRILGETDFTNDLDELLKAEASGSYTYQPSHADEVHGMVADTLDTELFFGEDGVEEYIGKAIADRLDSDERTVEILNALALATYPNELGMFSLDERGEAFFMGANVAMKIVTKAAEYKQVDDFALTKIWRANPVHMKLYKDDVIPESRILEVDQQMTRILVNASIHPEYEKIADKICDELEYDVDESTAFKNGLQYVLSTGFDAVAKTVDTKIKRSARQEAKGLDDEIKNFFNGESL